MEHQATLNNGSNKENKDAGSTVAATGRKRKQRWDVTSETPSADGVKTAETRRSAPGEIRPQSSKPCPMAGIVYVAIQDQWLATLPEIHTLKPRRGRATASCRLGRVPEPGSSGRTESVPVLWLKGIGKQYWPFLRRWCRSGFPKKTMKRGGALIRLSEDPGLLDCTVFAATDASGPEDPKYPSPNMYELALLLNSEPCAPGGRREVKTLDW